MSLFKKKRYKSDSQYEINSIRQMEMSPETVGRLRELGVTEDMEYKLEYFFYTNDDEKARKLAQRLNELGYNGGSSKSNSDKKLFLISGWTVPIKMCAKSVVQWTEMMCKEGQALDCEFDGWGTNAKQ